MFQFYFAQVIVSIEKTGKLLRYSRIFNAIPLILDAGRIKNLMRSSSYLSSCRS